MATKPLRSEDPNPKPVQFAHFGVLDTGTRSKGAAITSITINLAILAFIVVLGLIVKNNPVVAKKVAELTLPPKPPVEQPKPKPPPPPPPKPLPKPPEIKELPKIKLPEPVKLPPEIKPVIMPTPKPVVITPPAPKRVDPPPAPRVVNLSQPHAASIANNDAHPSAVRLGNTAIKSLNGPAVATKVNLGGGVPGMSASNTGNGPHATSVNLGSGSPEGTNINGRGRGAVVVKGFNNGVPGGTGTGRSGPVSVQIKPAEVAVAQPRAESVRTMATPPTLISRPNPVYTADAKAAHVEGRVIVRLTIKANGSVEVLSATGLGHGLEEAATNCMRASRWKPALDSGGRPIDYTLNTAVIFALNN